MLMGLAVMYMPFSRSFISLIIDMFINGIVCGILLTGSCVQIVDLWGKQAQPFVQIQQFAFGLGAFSGPLIAQPFLLQRNIESVDEFALNQTAVELILESDDFNPIASHYLPEQVKLVVPFSIVGGLGVFGGIISLIAYKLCPKSKPHPSRLIDDNVNGKTINSLEKTSAELKSEKQFNRWKMIVMCVISLFMPLYYGVEVSYGNYVSPFVQFSQLRMDASTGAFLSSIYWITFTFFRLFAAFYIPIIGSEMNIILSLAVMLSANIALIPFGETHSTAVYISTVLSGIGTSSVWGSVFGFLENYFPVTSKMTAAMISVTFAGDCILPVVISYFIETYPKIFQWIYLVSSVSMAFTFAVACLLCRTFLKQDSKVSIDPYRLRTSSARTGSFVH